MFKKLTIARGGRRARSPLPLPVPGAGQEGQRRHGAWRWSRPGSIPTSGAAAAIAEVTLYNVYETLTKINEDGSVSPLLAESWQASPDLKTYTFKLRKGVKFQNGEPFNSAAVKFSFERNGGADQHQQGQEPVPEHSQQVTAPDADTVVITLKNSEPNLPFLLGQATARSSSRRARRPTPPSRSAPGPTRSAPGPRARRSR